MNKYEYNNDGKVIYIEDNSLESVVKDNNIALVDFWAPWCGPCRMLAPVLDQLAEEFKDKANIVKVDTDKNQDLAVNLGIRSVPTVMFFKNGVLIESIVGVKSKDFYISKLNELKG